MPALRHFARSNAQGLDGLDLICYRARGAHCDQFTVRFFFRGSSAQAQQGAVVASAWSGHVGRSSSRQHHHHHPPLPPPSSRKHRQPGSCVVDRRAPGTCVLSVWQQLPRLCSVNRQHCKRLSLHHGKICFVGRGLHHTIQNTSYLVVTGSGGGMKHPPGRNGDTAKLMFSTMVESESASLKSQGCSGAILSSVFLHTG